MKVSYTCSLEGNDFIKLQHDQCDDGVVVSFQRTIRVPDSAQVNNLPPTLGRFPLYKVCDYSDKLPAGMVAKRGVFLPIYRELKSAFLVLRSFLRW
jgi:hypothetical protein